MGNKMPRNGHPVQDDSFYTLDFAGDKVVWAQNDEVYG